MFFVLCCSVFGGVVSWRCSLELWPQAEGSSCPPGSPAGRAVVCGRAGGGSSRNTSTARAEQHGCDMIQAEPPALRGHPAAAGPGLPHSSSSALPHKPSLSGFTPSAGGGTDPIGLGSQA